MPGSTDTVDVAGARAVVLRAAEPGDLTAAVWSPEPDVTVLFGWRGDPDVARSVLASITEVDAATWEAGSVVDTSDDDGCYSLFC